MGAGSHRLCVSLHQPLQMFAGPAAPKPPKVLVDAGLPQALTGPCGSWLPQVMCFLPSTAATVPRPCSANATKSTGRPRATTGSHRLCVSSHQPLQPFAGPAAPTLPKVLVDAGLPQALTGSCGSWLASDAIAGKPAPTGYVFPPINRCNRSPAPQRQHHQKCWSMPGYHTL